MVHPYLTTDPAKRQGSIGKVTNVSKLNKDMVTVQFEDGVTARYLSDGLLTLFPKSVIRQGLASNTAEISPTDRKLIKQVLDLASARKYEDALQLAFTNNTVKFYCLVDCANYIEMKSSQQKSPHKSRKH